MHNHYIINNWIEFHPAKSILRRLDAPENVVILNSPASRCFLLLIKKVGIIVSQQEFMDEVWVKNGVHVSPNTFYQNISILRKGLKKIGFEEELIVTIPRIGITLSNECHITKLVTEQLIDINQHNVEVITERHISTEDEIDIKNELESTTPSSDSRTSFISAKSLSNNNTAEQSGYGIFYQRYLPLFILISGLGILLMMSYMIVKKMTPIEYLQEYIPVSGPPACNVYVSPDVVFGQIQDKTLRYAEPFYSACNSYPWIYIDSLPQLPRVSVLRCSRKNGNHSLCISDYFILDN